MTDEARSDQDPKAGADPAPDLGESLRGIGATGRASVAAAADAAKALRSLLAADLSLARSAFGRTLAFAGLAIVFGASAWLLLVATLIAFLRGLGLSWFAAMLIGAALSLAVTAYAVWQAARYFEHTRLQATRRQLARLGIGELADLMPKAGATESARDVAQQQPAADENGQPRKDPRGVNITPP